MRENKEPVEYEKVSYLWCFSPPFSLRSDWSVARLLFKTFLCGYLQIASYPNGQVNVADASL